MQLKTISCKFGQICATGSTPTQLETILCEIAQWTETTKSSTMTIFRTKNEVKPMQRAQDMVKIASANILEILAFDLATFGLCDLAENLHAQREVRKEAACKFSSKSVKK